MTLDYFYGNQADQFTFYRIPKVLFTDERFKAISAEAKILYGILLDRMALSQKNEWLDEAGRVYIIYTTEEVMASIGCADQKATKLFAELEKKAGLIERKRQGLGKPSLIFVKNFIVERAVDNESDLQDSRFKSRENHDSVPVKTTIQEPPKSRCSNTDNNYTNQSDTDSYPFPSGKEPFHCRDRMRRDMDERARYQNYFEDQLDVEILKQSHHYEEEMIDEILTLLVDTVCSNREFIRIAGDDKPKEVVKSQLLKLDSQHIEYVLSSFKENASKVRNIKQYLLASLYNAPMTISNYYDVLVRHDMAAGGF